MLAYHAGCTENISGMIFTNLLDQRIKKIRDASAYNKILSNFGLPNYRRESLTHEMGGDESANQIENVPLL